MTILVTGGAGFIGANFVLDWLSAGDEPVITLDKLTYAGNLESLAAVADDHRFRFVQGDICDAALVATLLAEQRPRAIVHFAAESHVDRSIRGPGEFMRSNVDGTFTLLEGARAYWHGLVGDDKSGFRFLHVLSPCPTGWKSEPSEGIALVRLAIRAGLFPVVEVFDGWRTVINVEPEMSREALEEYLARQGRFRKGSGDIEAVRRAVEQHWKSLRARAALEGRDD